HGTRAADDTCRTSSPRRRRRVQAAATESLGTAHPAAAYRASGVQIARKALSPASHLSHEPCVDSILGPLRDKARYRVRHGEGAVCHASEATVTNVTVVTDR